jgi:hypothetical protein
MNQEPYQLPFTKSFEKFHFIFWMVPLPKSSQFNHFSDFVINIHNSSKTTYKMIFLGLLFFRNFAINFSYN